MKRENLNKYLGDMVRVTFMDGEIKIGFLGFTPEFSPLYGYRKPHYYTLGDIDFKASHVKKIRRM